MADFLTLALPFIFVFAVAFGALEVSGVFKAKGGSSNKRINGLIALVVAFFAISTEWVLLLIMQILPIAAVIFILVFLVGFITRPFETEEGKKRDVTLILIVVVLGLIFLTGQGYQMLSDVFPYMGIQMDPANFMYLAGLVLVVLLLYAAYKKSEKFQA